MNNKLNMLPLKTEFETIKILKQLSKTNRALAELKGFNLIKNSEFLD